LVIKNRNADDLSLSLRIKLPYIKHDLSVQPPRGITAQQKVNKELSQNARPIAARPATTLTRGTHVLTGAALIEAICGPGFVVAVPLRLKVFVLTIGVVVEVVVMLVTPPIV
jgi:hypothetical protein